MDGLYHIHTYLHIYNGHTRDTSISNADTYVCTGDGCIYIILNHEYTKDLLVSVQSRPVSVSLLEYKTPNVVGPDLDLVAFL